ncbi:hypothetical protein [Roseisolibacter agri]|uniref:DUF11 domain-containing protein n=1 Tax=Roseisolibacter agri TaxID=2014610 RepID=A0AA37Q0E9_9BACT|nr:hypothetical protein [Roseisolibacter agri]GLC24099.1 hypothetical protein rosag_06120 [Roseisolibacter agri]
MTRFPTTVRLGAALASLALAAACSDAPTPPAPRLTPGTPSFAASADISSQNAFQQCANGNPLAPTCNYINSVLNASKSQYNEGEVIAQKLVIKNATTTGADGVHTLVISYGFQKSSSVTNANYDFQARYDATLGTVRANPCLDNGAVMTPFCSGGQLKTVGTGVNQLDFDEEPFPAPTAANSINLSASDLTKLQAAFARFAGARTLVIYNGSFDNLGAPAISDVTYAVNSSDIEATVTYRFRATKSDVLLLWGMHFASEIDWKNNGLPVINGAAGQSGSPFHVKLITLDGSSNGAKALNVSGDVVRTANVGITKTADADTVNAGNPIGFTITVTNGGNADALNVAIVDTLPTGFTWSVAATGTTITGCTISGGVLTCTPFTLAAATSTPTTASVHVTAPTTATTPCGLITNTARFTTSNDGSGSGTGQVRINCPNITIDKSPASQTKSAGESFSWTVVLTNTGAGTAFGARILDTLPQVTGVSYTLGAASDATCGIASSVLTCGPKDLAQNDTLRAIVNATTTAGTSCAANGIRNIATGRATGLSDVKDTATVTLNCPALSILKTPKVAGDTGYTVQPGDSARFTIKVKNTGGGSAFSTTLTDTLPAGLSWSDNQAACTTTGVTATTPTRQILQCNIGTLAASDSFVVKVAALVPTNFLLPPTSSAVPALEIDGNLTSNGGPDWATLPDTLLKCTTPKLNCNIDTPTGPADSSFGQGTKEDTPVPSVVSGSIPNNKADLQRFYLTTRRVLVGGVVHDVLYLAWERVQQPSGTTNMDFELNQLTTLSANGVTPTRKAGDVLVKYDLSKGGGTLALGVHRWVETGNPATVCQASNTVPCWGKVDSLVAPTGTGASNTPAIGQVQDPIAPGSRMLDTLTFGEAAIDLQGAGIFQAGTCLVFGRAYLKSRSSDAFTSEIKDFIAPIPINVENCQDKLLDNRAWATASGLTAVSDSGQIRVVAPSGSASLDVAPGITRVATSRGPSTTMEKAVASSHALEQSVVRTTRRVSGDRRRVAPGVTLNVATGVTRRHRLDGRLTIT